jgi:mercuric ion binding protein
MKKAAILLSMFSVILLGCSETPKNNTIEDNSNEETREIPVVGNRMLTLEIEGMTCVMGCGGSIRNELAETKAIESCDFDFEQGREKNIAKIAYDKDKITVDEIISIVSNLNDGQFSVGSKSSNDITVNIKTTVETVDAKHIDDSKLKVSTSQSSVALPNIMEILASFFHN